MPYAGAVDVSSSAWLAYVKEVTPGVTPGTPTWSLIPAEYSGSAWPETDPARAPVKLLNSSPNSIIGYIDKQGRTRATIVQPIIPTFIGNWISAMGLQTTGTAIVGPPSAGIGFWTVQPTISLLDVYGGIGARVFAGMRCSKITFSSSSATGEAMCVTELIGTVPAATITTPSVPGVVFEDPYDWANWQPPTQPGGTTTAECDDWELVCDFLPAEFWGGGQVMPTHNNKTAHQITGKFTFLQVVAEETAFIARTTGQFEFEFLYPSGSHSITFNIPKGKYVTYVVDESETRYITAQVTYGALSTDLSDVLSIIIS